MALQVRTSRGSSVHRRASGCPGLTIQHSIRSVRTHANTITRQEVPGETVIVQLAHLILSNPFLHSLGIAAGRSVMQRTAQKRGIPWVEHLQVMKEKQQMMEDLKASLENKDVEYPSYYLQPFHAYPDGNLCWKAACEVEPLRMVVAARTFKDLPADQAAQVLGANTAKVIQEYRRSQAVSSSVGSILDIGCGYGGSTWDLADAFPQSDITGIDLSPYFLSVAQMREDERVTSGQRVKSIKYLHAQAENSGLPSASFDLVSIMFVFHECPTFATKAILKEACRLLRPGGQIAIIDTDPNCETIRQLHPVILLLREQTEPWMNEFRNLDLEACLRELGMGGVETRSVTNRHMAVMGIKQ